MSDVFVSYTREDRPKVELLASALEAQGWSVWWDRSIPAGRTFDDVIEEAIDAAKCVVVLWSKKSVESRWVRTEAEVGSARDRLVPAIIEEVTIPLAFRRIQAANLVDWDGDAAAPCFQALSRDIEQMLGTEPVEAPTRSAEVESSGDEKRGPSRLGRGLGLKIAVGALVVAIGLVLIFVLRGGEEGQRPEAVTADLSETVGDAAAGGGAGRTVEPAALGPAAAGGRQVDRVATQSADTSSEQTTGNPPAGPAARQSAELPIERPKEQSQPACTDAKAVLLVVDGSYRSQVVSAASGLETADNGCWRMELQFGEPIVEDVDRGGGSTWKSCDVEASFRLSYMDKQLESYSIAGEETKFRQREACSAAIDEIAGQAVRRVAQVLASN